MKMGFENFNLKRIELHINEKNLPSRKSVEKYGAKLDGILR
jgi:RimJ/RimL family protein N-acetyltransferase